MNPYSNLPAEAFWARAVGQRHFWDIAGLAKAKCRIGPQDRIATAGSCFAQHISRRLRSAGFDYLDVEPAPPGLSAPQQQRFGYGMFSARYGNIYTSGQLRQLYLRAHGEFEPAEEPWESDGRFFDPFRPSIEEDGFASPAELQHSRAAHLHAVRALFANATVFVFTLGLTEAWRSRADGAYFPVCPGTKAGRFDPARYEFVNLTHAQVIADMRWVIERATAANPGLRFLLTVSPVPLTATASGEHVLTATTYSKSVLRAVCGELQQQYANVDYFPSYEIITGTPFGGVFYEANKREVRPEGVDFVMGSFMRDFCERPERVVAARVEEPDEEDVLCDEQQLEAYAP